MRYVCLDFETNGFAQKGAPPCFYTLPFSSYPIQLAVSVVEDGVVRHEYDTLIRGATRFAKWVWQNVPIPLHALKDGKGFPEVIEDFASILKDGDVLVAHNADFDLGTVFSGVSRRLGIDTPALQKILQMPRFCTMKCAYSKSVFSKQPSMGELCAHFQVPLEGAHDARADTKALAECVAEALRRGVMFG